MKFEEKIDRLNKVKAAVEGLEKEAQVEAIKFLLGEPAEAIEKSMKKRKPKKKRLRGGNKKKVSGIRIQVDKLCENGFFNEPKLINEISNQLSIKGFNVKLPQLSPILIRLVRNGSLLRHKNSEGKYVYYKEETKEE